MATPMSTMGRSPGITGSKLGSDRLSSSSTTAILSKDTGD
jgi:hypothetical protein